MATPPVLPQPSPLELLREIRARGWRAADLAWWLGVGRSTLYQAINNPARGAVWNLALLHLPALTPAQLQALRGQRLALARHAPLPEDNLSLGLEVGDELVALRHLGELADEGTRAVVAAIEPTRCLLHFAGGADWFGREQVARDFAETGRKLTE